MFDEFEQYEQQRQAYSTGIDRFSQYLMNGEDILWQGESQKGGGWITNGIGLFQKMFGVFWLGFSLLWTFIATMGGGIMGLFGIPFIAVGIYILFGKSRKKYYAITNRRVLIICGKKLSAEFLGKICDVNVSVGKNNIGSIIYRTSNVRYVHNSGSEGNYQQIGGCLYNIYDPNEVYRILCEAVFNIQNGN